MSWCDLDLIFDLLIVIMSFKILSGLFLGILDWIAAIDYYMHFYMIVLFPVTAILHLINFTPQ